MKHTRHEYENCNFYGSSEMESNYSAKVICLRTDRGCVNCGKNQAKGDYMLKEQAVIEGEGWKSAYTCLPCLDKWIDETK